jgi:ABC-type sugar transport system ATPase subunit/ribose/xylose/arabinose/galactoside ABC-type transport system permease subunit
MSAAAQLVGISKSFPGVTALADVDLTLRPGSIHALVGENGAGKSTLINILSGVLPPDRGEIRVAGQPVHLRDAHSARRLGIVTVHQEVDLFPDLTIAENIGLEQGLAANRLGWINWREQRRRAQAALESVGEELSTETLAGVLSPAQRQLVEVAAAVSQQARVLILDEPTSSLSAAEAEVLFGHLRRFRAQGAAILYVSHRLEELFALADEATVLRDGRRVWTGPVAETSPQHLIAQMVGRAVTASGPSARTQPGAVRLRCQGLTAADGSFQDITLEVRVNEVLGLYGLVGAGRSEWAQALFGLRGLASGEVWLNGQRVRPRGPRQMVRRGLAYVPEDRLRQGLCRGLSVRANAVLASLRELARGLWLSRTAESRYARSTVERLAVRLSSIEQPVGTLSGGNQQKVVLGRWLGRDPGVIVLDEPTRGVDVGAKAEIHALIRRLAGEGRAVVFISSDLHEVLAQCDRVGVFREGRLVTIRDAHSATAEEVAAAAVPGGVIDVGAGFQPAQTSGQVGNLPPRAEAQQLNVGGIVREAALLLVLLALFAFLQAQTGEFLQAGNLRNLATEAALLSFCAVGATLVILAGGIDISLGALMALSAGVAGRLWEHGHSAALVLPLAVLVGGAGGLLNAGLSLLGRIHPIVVTLGTMSVYRGLTLWWIEQDVQVAGDVRRWVVRPLLGLPLVVWGAMALLALAWLFLSRTVWGREVYALGSNPTAAHRVGVERGRVWLMAFTLQGMLAGLAGFLCLARSGGLQPTDYDDRTLAAIAAAVVGGVAITGGRGTVWGVALGCLFLVSLGPAGIYLRVAPEWQRALVGGVMAVAVVLDTLWRRRSA